MTQTARRMVPGARAARRTVSVLECGRLAQRIVAEQTQGIVCAVFRRSCYLDFAGGRVLCVGERALGRGPLNVLVDAFQPPRLDDVLGLRADAAAVWRPATRPSRPSQAALSALCAAASACVPAEGLGRLICRGSSPLIEHVRPALVALERWQAGGTLTAEVTTLLGLGPGLTPSGDDYLGGMLIGLRLFGRAADAEVLWAWLAPRVSAGTSRISAAHLAAAAEGEAHETLHACIDALAEGLSHGWPARLAALASIGHCSGWDGLAGVIAAAERVAV